jgi:hypothetical protein
MHSACWYCCAAAYICRYDSMHLLLLLLLAAIVLLFLLHRICDMSHDQAITAHDAHQCAC